ncbi:MOSC domain-containing protein [Litoreibacter roseus]|uniref:Molybdenum cofactor sulfurase n=1 Tax=Litoreibacter roseus TaxID=2601869 RepID=A0A6N6JHR7_9RHOB|nr:MOSC domain-containing protein [Litoreibacter roseus]GFE64939.1 molybdenum cofactor sulfurase [Litoreibacter roseus]
MITIKRIQRFPIKGLSPEGLDNVTLHPGEGVPGDRMYGFARHGSGFDPENPKPLPKDRFVVLLNQAGLAGVHSTFSPDTSELSVVAGGAKHVFDMSAKPGRDSAAAWLADHLKLQDEIPPNFVSAAPHRFTDVSVVSPQMMNAISIINRASVRDLEVRLGTKVDPARFRGNLELDGLPPWWELENIDAILQMGDVKLQLIMRTKRCAATEVNPTTAERDLRLPYLLRKELGHMDMGAYAQVIEGGILQVGQTVTCDV